MKTEVSFTISIWLGWSP